MNLYSVLEHRSGERLIQAALLWALNNDKDFQKAFCDWLDWPVFTHVEEEQQDPAAGLRYDLSFHFDQEPKERHAELKLFAPYTSGQEAQLFERNQLLLVPDIRKRREGLPGEEGQCVIRTWEDLVETPGKAAKNSKLLLEHMIDYFWSGTIKQSEVVESFKTIEGKRTGQWTRNYEFLNSLWHALGKHYGDNLSLGATIQPNRSDEVRYQGFYMYRKGEYGSNTSWLWIGFICGEDHNPDVQLTLEASKPIGAAMELNYVPKHWWNEKERYEQVIEPDPGQLWKVEEVMDTLEAFIGRFIGME